MNSSLKASERIPGLRPKPPKVRGAPPAWADWVHKFGPLVTALVSAAIFFATLAYTIEPVYRRALLEESNSRLQLELARANVSLEQTNAEIAKSSQALSLQRAEAADKQVALERYASQLADAKLFTQRAQRERLLSDESRRSAERDRATAQADLTRVTAELSEKSRSFQAITVAADSAQKRLDDTIVRSAVDRVYSVSICRFALINTALVGTSQKSAGPLPIELFDNCIREGLENAIDTNSNESTAVVTRLRSIAMGVDERNSANYLSSRERVSELMAAATSARRKFETELARIPKADIAQYQRLAANRYSEISRIEEMLSQEINRATKVFEAAITEFERLAK